MEGDVEMGVGKMNALYFIAVVAPEEIGFKVNAWKHWMRDNFGCKAALRSPAHITLVPPFKMEQDNEDHLNSVLASFAESHSDFDIALNGFGSFGRKVIFIQVEHNTLLNQCYDDLNHYLQQQVPGLITPDSRPFHPHVTIATRDIPHFGFRTALEHFSHFSYRAVFRPDGITLLKLSPARWESLASFKFKSEQ